MKKILLSCQTPQNKEMEQLMSLIRKDIILIHKIYLIVWSNPIYMDKSRVQVLGSSLQLHKKEMAWSVPDWIDIILFLSHITELTIIKIKKSSQQ